MINKHHFLTYDTNWLTRFYHQTSQRATMLRNKELQLTAPYEIIVDYRNQGQLDWGSWEYSGEFCIAEELTSIKKQFISMLEQNDGLYKGNNVCPRVKTYSIMQNKLLLKLEKASYFDQVATNLALDYPLDETDATTLQARCLREWDLQQSNTPHGTLPSFESSQLANTIGVSLGITVKNKNNEKVFLTRTRTSHVAVAAHQEVLPFSFSLNFNPTPSMFGKQQSIKELIKADFIQEQAEELSIDASVLDFENVKPLLLCRELCRGGKPQFFCEIELDMCYEDLQNHISENLLPQKEFTSTIKSHTLNEAQQSFSTLSPEIQAFVVAKSS